MREGIVVVVVRRQDIAVGSAGADNSHLGRQERKHAAPSTFVISTANGFHAGVVLGLRGKACKSFRRSAAHTHLCICSSSEIAVRTILQHPIVCRAVFHPAQRGGIGGHICGCQMLGSVTTTSGIRNDIQQNLVLHIQQSTGSTRCAGIIGRIIVVNIKSLTSSSIH